MLKSLGYKVEVFKGYYVVSQEDLPSMKQACFDIQVQLVRFFTSAVKSIRGGEEEGLADGALYGKLRPIKASSIQEVIKTYILQLEAMNQTLTPGCSFSVDSQL